MWNPFKKDQEEHDDLFQAFLHLAMAIDKLQVSVKELREEVDYLVDVLDD